MPSGMDSINKIIFALCNMHNRAILNINKIILIILDKLFFKFPNSKHNKTLN